ncbi:MAG: ankyrin repeat domain-containing protein [Bacteroidota bacterium]
MFLKFLKFSNRKISLTALLLLTFLYNHLFSQNQDSLNILLLHEIKNAEIRQAKTLIGHGADVNFADTNKATCLMCSVYKPNLKMVKYLISKGADYTKKGIIPLGDGGWYGNLTGDLLFYAIDKGNLKFAKYCIGQGISIEIKDQVRITPYMYSLFMLNPAMGIFFIDKGANMNCSVVNGITALQIAMIRNDSGILKNLPLRGINPPATISALC